MFLTAVSVAVAAVPEGLPAVVTIALALGARRMLERHALIRRLPAVETLGSVTVICSDKTGTLTQNRMTVTVLEVAGHRRDIGAPSTSEGAAEAPAGARALTLLLAGGALCNDALPGTAEGAPAGGALVGDPTEVALAEVAARFGLAKPELEAAFPRLAEVPFDATRKRMTTLHAIADSDGAPTSVASLADGFADTGWSHLTFTKGAVASVLAVSTGIWVESRVEPLDARWRDRITAAGDRLAGEGTRVLGVAFRGQTPPGVLSPGASETDLTFVGLIGMRDPVRPEAGAAVRTCREAGIRPVMITGDHPLTARAIAGALGIGSGERIRTDRDLAQLSPDDLDRLVDEVAIYARVSPEHKLAIVEALQRRGQIVAMTGDGVNDAPALKKADIGVAMGLVGTDVAKEAADMVLLDDNFATLVAAVEQGRVIYANLRKFIRYMLACNSGELWVMLLAPLLGMPFPLLPLQILWMNLVTDGLSALALSLEPAERQTMRRPPRSPREHVLGGGMGPQIVWAGLLLAAVSLGAGLLYWRAGDAGWQTMVFTVLTFGQMAHVLGLHSARRPGHRWPFRGNPWLPLAVALTVGLQLLLLYTPFLRGIFGTTALSPTDLLVGVALSSVVLVGIEIERRVLDRRNGRA
jgi:Ca2+-transporting ATPase